MLCTHQSASTFEFQMLPSSSGEQQLSVTPSRRSQIKITSILSWLEAWTTFWRIKVHLHPHLTLDLLTYQYQIITFNKSYSFDDWYKYDIAFRMNTALDHSLSWNRTDSYAFNKFLRSAPGPSGPPTCFRCHETGHIAPNCPNSKLFRPYQANNITPQFQQTPTNSTLPSLINSSTNAPFRASQSLMRSNNRLLSTYCRNYNRNYGCTNAKCSRPHKCNGPGCEKQYPGSTCSLPY